MFKAACPSCGKHFWFFVLKREEEKKWYQAAKLLHFCPHCGTEIIEMHSHTKWMIVFILLALVYCIFVLPIGWLEVLKQYRFVLLILIAVALLLSLRRKHKLAPGTRKYPFLKKKDSKNNI
jgi:Ca2+/Na+ antiporter